MSSDRIGLNCALSTPFRANASIDPGRLVAHARWVMEHGCDGITVFGTTGEGASVGLPGRYQALGALDAAGIDLGRRVFCGVAAATLEDVVEQSRMALEAGCRGLLLAPPFYFGGVGDEALFAFFSRVFERLGPIARGVLLYHIPGMTRVHISVELTRRLAEAFPGVIIGVKDSHGDWAATERRLADLKDLQILVGDERQLARAVRHGGAGSICGLANVAPDLLRPLAWDGVDDPRIGLMVEAILAHSFMPAIKALIAEQRSDPEWRQMRPPLEALAAADGHALHARLSAIRAMARAA
jgi:4-hydroxy-tetrahydrodipicolinate synthase